MKNLAQSVTSRVLSMQPFAALPVGEFALWAMFLTLLSQT